MPETGHGPVSDPIGVAVVGLGRSGWDLHCRAIASMPDWYRLVSAFDELEPRRTEAAQRFACATPKSLEALLQDPRVEVVAVALPSHLHAQVAIRSLAAGRHVVVDKPFATSLADAMAMVAAAAAAGRILTCSQNMRFAADFLKVRDVIRSGRLGTVLQVRIAWHRFRRRWDWQTATSLGGGVLNNDGSHAVDQALELFGDGEPRVFCRCAHTPLSSGDAENHVKIVLSGEGRPLFDVELTDSCACPQTTWHVMGSRGGLTGDEHGLEWKYVETSGLQPRPLDMRPTPDRSFNREALDWKLERCTFTGENPHHASFARFYEDLAHAIREDRIVSVSTDSLLRQVRVLEECRRQGVSEIA